MTGPGRPTERFTDKAYLRTAAYGDDQRLGDRAAIYRYLTIDSIDLGPHPFRAETIAGVFSTFLDPAIGGAALDVGCGRGTYLPVLAGQFDRVVAGDLSEGMLASCPPGGWLMAVVDVESLAFRDAAFDVVLANHMLYHAPDLPVAVRELRRVVRRGGVLFAATNGSGNFRAAYEILAAAAGRVSGRTEPVLEPLDHRFSLASGAAGLRAEFASVEVKHTVGRIRLTDEEACAAMLRYYRSVDDEWVASYELDWEALEKALAVELRERLRRGGVIEIPAHSGLLVAV